MNKYYYRKSIKINIRQFGRLFGVIMIIFGISLFLYIFFPLLVWQVALAPVFASEGISSPIPRSTIVNPATIKSLLISGVQALSTNYDDANNWFNNISLKQGNFPIGTYSISIPSININNAQISTLDTDLAHHMIHFGGSALPPNKGVAIVFGHSTLPQLYDPSNYHTILANAYKIKVGDNLLVTVDKVTYTYKVYSLLVINPDDTSVLIQHYDDSYFELITCTPPGTIWQRLVIQGRLEKI